MADSTVVTPVKQEPQPQRENSANSTPNSANKSGRKAKKRNRRRNLRGRGAGDNKMNPTSFANRAQNPQSGTGDHVVAPSNEVGERRPNIKKNDDHIILHKLSLFVGLTYDLQPISQEEIKFSNRNRLYVGNLNNDVTENDLKELFAPFGEIAETFINKEKHFAFVKVDLRTNAEKAKRELHGVVYKGRNIRIDFAPNATCVKVLNLDFNVTNELLYRTFEIFGPVERAVIIVDDRGKSTGEGIVEFARKNSALSCIRFCEERCLFLTASLKPCIVEAYDLIDDSDGFSEKSIKNCDVLKVRKTGPQFASNEEGARQKQLHEMFTKKKEALKRELLNDIEKLDAQGKNIRYDQETELLREQLRQREQDRDRQRLELEMKERRADEQMTREEEQMRRTNEDMQMKMKRQEEELLRRQHENTLFMQAQQERKNFDYPRRGDHFDMPQGSASGCGQFPPSPAHQLRMSVPLGGWSTQHQQQHPQQQHPQQQHMHQGGCGGNNGGGNNHSHQGAGGGGGPMRNKQRQWDRRGGEDNNSFQNKRRRY